MRNLAIAATAMALVAGFSTAHIGAGATATASSSSPTLTTKKAESTTVIRRWRLPRSADAGNVTVRPRVKTNGRGLRRTVVLQRRVTGESWQRVFTKQTSKRGRVRIMLEPLASETLEFRLRVRGTKKYPSRKSRALRLTAASTGRSPGASSDPTPGDASNAPAAPGNSDSTDPGSPTAPGTPDTSSPLDLCGADAQHSVTGYVSDGALDEISGLTASRRTSNRYWVHNDSGDGPHLYAINSAGSLRQTVSLSGVSPRDWEDIATGPGPIGGEPYLYVADFGQPPSTEHHRDLPPPGADRRIRY